LAKGQHPLCVATHAVGVGFSARLALVQSVDPGARTRLVHALSAWLRTRWVWASEPSLRGYARGGSELFVRWRFCQSLRICLSRTISSAWLRTR